MRTSTRSTPRVPATVGDLLTQRRAVDLQRTESALCRLGRPVA